MSTEKKPGDKNFSEEVLRYHNCIYMPQVQSLEARLRDAIAERDVLKMQFDMVRDAYVNALARILSDPKLGIPIVPKPDRETPKPKVAVKKRRRR